MLTACMDLSTEIMGVKLPFFVLNASGCRDDNLAQLKEIGKSKSGAILMKSCTIKKSLGNPLPRYFHNEYYSINSMGLPNPGYREYTKYPAKLKKYGKPVIASIAGNNVKDYTVMVKAFQKSSADLIELDLSCPNVIGKPIIGYNFGLTEKIIKKTTEASRIPIGLKMAPFLDLSFIDEMADIIKKYNVAYIACINTLGNTMIINPETQKPVIKPKGGFGGLGGRAIKPVALGNVHAFYERLKGKISIMGVGGIETGTDLFEFALAGANACQIGTMFIKEGTKIFDRMEKEFSEWLKKKGFKTAKSVVGKLKKW